MSTEWITDRLPTVYDGAYINGIYDAVWVWHPQIVEVLGCDDVKPGTPWQPISKPAPYVKPNRWKIEWNSIGAYWVVVNDDYRVPQYYLNYKDQDAAQRICDIFNEVMP